MTELLITLGLVAGLVWLLQPAHSHGWRPGFDSRVDRDLARQRHELDLLATFEPAEASPSAQPLNPAEHPPTAERHRSGRAPVLERRRSTGLEAFGAGGRAA